MATTRSNQRRLALSLYLNYLVHGIGLIILTQNMQSLEKFWNVPLATVSYVVSGIGIGRLLSYFLFGYLSDRFGRKQLISLGILSYMIFFIGIPFTHSIQVAYLLTILAGVANSALDSGTYPTFMEMGGNSDASSVFIKAFVAVGEFILPLFIVFLDIHALWYGWSFMIVAVILLFNFFLLAGTKFPAQNSEQPAELEEQQPVSKARRIAATIALSIYGYTTMALMILFTQWISLFATKELGYSGLAAHALLSLYSTGSITGVLVIFTLLKFNVSKNKILVAMNVLSLLALLVVIHASVVWVTSLAAFIFGFSAAGGVLQVALNLLLQMFPKHKGVITGLYFMFGSVAAFTIPLVTGMLSKINLYAVMNFDVLVGALGAALVIVTALLLETSKVASFLRQTVNRRLPTNIK
ncbi:MFS transporter [Liquorilactobacillus satsumensis]|uniref:Major facilitator superfamily protein n=1 Tax=Liquorilactobacillus satsumensis DSM 16230 = JCM 12392 TaxID=1423801 RepID=A0A0R1V1Q7_9LACO|nr:MFS transporter [Liquorilactobacillus satsumensis]KRL97112.1 major facilitator superfamily protein [Liquorilactobacillus satsumensis DSM 16230 = JCM 12392]